MANSEPIHYKELRETLEESLGIFPHISDKTYAYVSEDYLLSAAKRLLDKNKRRGLEYGPKWDCDDFTIDFVNHIKKSHALTAGGADAEGVAVGYISFRDEDVGFHAIVWFLAPDGNVKFIEPQTAEIDVLSEKEKEDVCHVWG